MPMKQHFTKKFAIQAKNAIVKKSFFPSPKSPSAFFIHDQLSVIRGRTFAVGQDIFVGSENVDDSVFGTGPMFDIRAGAARQQSEGGIFDGDIFKNSLLCRIDKQTCLA